MGKLQKYNKHHQQEPGSDQPAHLHSLIRVFNECSIGSQETIVSSGRKLRPPVEYFTDRSKAVLLLWIFYVLLSCVCYAFVRVCLYVPCGHLLGNG